MHIIIGICGVAQETVPFDYVLHEGTINAAFFSDVILMMVADETLVHGNILVMDNAAIHHYHESSVLEDVFCGMSLGLQLYSFQLEYRN
jgi:hypothetical protein